MTQVSDIVGFKRDLFFDGAVQIGWYEKDVERRDRAATGFVFHGPEYHGVSEDDLRDSGGYPLTDTVRFTADLVKSLAQEGTSDLPIALAIAGYGTGKSHLGISLATLLSDPQGSAAHTILKHIEEADPKIGQQIRHRFNSFDRPFLVVAIDGMGNFDLAGELSRQVLTQMRAQGVNTAAIEELSPRFQIAEAFVERNFDFRDEEFRTSFDPGISREEIIQRLRDRDETAYLRVNEIFRSANGFYINATGQESPQQLIQTVCQSYCGDGGPFQGLLVVFDEFGRYLEFAAASPHIAGDAALQQIFQGVQDNADRCFLLCLVQYELKVYLQRISRSGQSSIQRYVTRYDAAKKFHLSTNLETLIAHLIEKKNPALLSECLSSPSGEQEWHRMHTYIRKWFPRVEQYAVWREPDRFRQVIVQGCWPLSPFAVWFLCRLEDMLQNRSAITFVKDVLDREAGHPAMEGNSPWTISAARLCHGSLVDELVAREGYGDKGAIAQAYRVVEEKYRNDLNDDERFTLLAILVASKIGIKVKDQGEAHNALSLFSHLPVARLEKAIGELVEKYGAIEWNKEFARYEIIGDAVPRSEFQKFLRNKTLGIPAEHVEEIFAAYMKNWAGLEEIDPDFAADKKITTTEWRFQTVCSHGGRIQKCIENAIQDWKGAVKTDSYRGQLVYVYVPPDANIKTVQDSIPRILDEALKQAGCTSQVPILLVLMHDKEGSLKRALSEYSVLTGPLTEEEKQRYAHFIENHKSQLVEEMKNLSEELVKQRLYVAPKGFEIENARLKIMTYGLFAWAYPKVVPFSFDGFSTARGNAAKDCREIVAELFKGTLNYDWISSRPPQMQNRARAMLLAGTSGWGVLGDDGELVRYPAHRGVREIIVELDNRLKDEGSLNLGNMLEMLVAPPFGFNIASAGILMGSFVAPRQDSVALRFQGQEVTPVAWISKALSGNFLDISILNDTELLYIPDPVRSEWDDLLSRWERETTHTRCVECMDEADSLRDRIPLPAGEHYQWWKRLHDKAEESLRTLEKFDKLIEEQERFFEIAYENQKVNNLSRVGKTLTERYRQMEQEQEFWTEEQFEAVQELIDKSRQAVIQFFDPWLARPDQRCLSYAQIADFKHKMLNQVGGNLKALDLKNLAERLERHVLNNISKLEELQKIAFIVDETRAFLSGHRVTGHSKVVDLKDWRINCESLEETLQKAKARSPGAPEIDEMLSRLQTFKNSCTHQIQQHRQRWKQLQNLEFSNFQSLRDGRKEAIDLMAIYGGEGGNLEDELRTMNQELMVLERDLSLWNDLTIPNEELQSMIEKRVEECAALEDAVWTTEDTYRRFAEHLFAERRRAAEQWMANACTSPEMIKTMRPEACQMLLQRLEAIPPYVDGDHRQVVSQLCKCAERRLDQLKVEGLLVKFRNMPPPLQGEFLKIATAEFKQKSGI